MLKTAALVYPAGRPQDRGALAAALMRPAPASLAVAVDFRDFRRIIPNASASCGSALLLAQLDRTALQFPTVHRAVYSFDGSVRRFYEWLQRSPPSAAAAAG